MKSGHLETDGKLLPSNTTLSPAGAAKIFHTDAWVLPNEMRKRVKGTFRRCLMRRMAQITASADWRGVAESREDVINAIEVACALND